MRGEPRVRAVMELVGHMSRLKRFTVPRLTRESGLQRNRVRSAVRVAEDLEWLSIDGFGDRLGGEGRGAVPIAYRWNGVKG